MRGHGFVNNIIQNLGSNVQQLLTSLLDGCAKGFYRSLALLKLS